MFMFKDVVDLQTVHVEPQDTSEGMYQASSSHIKECVEDMPTFRMPHCASKVY